MTQTTIHLPIHQPSASQAAWQRALAHSAIAAAAFVAALVCIMIVGFIREQATHPLNLNDISRWKEQLTNEPANDALKQKIRDADYQIRLAYFTRMAFLNRGAYLLLGGAIVLLVSAKTAAVLAAKPYLPLPDHLKDAEAPRVIALRGRAIGIGAALAAGVLLALGLLPTYKPPKFAHSTAAAVATVAAAPTDRPAAAPATAPVAAPAVAVSPAPTKESFLANWPSFRGPLGSGVVTVGPDEYPEHWDAAAGHNLLWKIEVPLPGHGTPIVWGDGVYLSGASKEKREVYCFDAKTGAIQWTQPVSAAGGPAKFEANNETGYAASSMATDGRRVYAIFATGDLAAFDLAGKPLWQKNLGVPVNGYGHASSLLASIDGRLFVQYDQGESAKEKKSQLFCFDGVTGKTVWTAQRPVMASWSTPLLAETPAGPQLVCAANPWLIAYNPADGTELWRAKVLDHEVVPSPIWAGGRVLAVNDGTALSALKPDGKGDVTKTHVAWGYEDNLPDVISPVAGDDLAWMLTTSGTITCVDMKTGQKAYDKDTDTQCHPSPVLVGKKLYLLDAKGVTHVLDATAREYKEIGRASLGAEEECTASPALAAGKIYLRGKQTLYCVGKK